MCSAPNVYMFVYLLIGTHMVPLRVIYVLSLGFLLASFLQSVSILSLIISLIANILIDPSCMF